MSDTTTLENSLHDLRLSIAKAVKHAQSLKEPKIGREISLVITKLQEAKMWGGKCLEMAGEPLPASYPHDEPADTSAEAGVHSNHTPA
ncbi:MAG: hypothetical protein LBK68_03125 [Candidatus Margulisbacteria bacterium]|nr:hypothetical protein [Candidatus Margulisiibacteriota bacterium]